MGRLLFLYTVLVFTFTEGLAQNNFIKLVQKVKPSVFKIITYDKFSNPMSQGTGFFVDSNGTALSNAHVFEGAHKADITMADGKSLKVSYIVSKDREIDIIKFVVNNQDTLKFPYLETNQDSLFEGDNIFVVGSPHGLEGTVSNGIISSIRKLDEFGEVIQITAPISHGSSGSPVINMHGRVFGIATLIHERGQNLNFAVDIHKIDSVMKDTIFMDYKKQLKLNGGRVVYLKNGSILTKNYFLKECNMIARDQTFKYGGVENFCACYQEKLLTNYTDEEISDLLSYTSVPELVIGSVQVKSNYFDLLKTCTSELTWTKDQEKYFISVCTANMQRHHNDEALNLKTYSACMLEKVKSSLTIDQSSVYLKYLQNTYIYREEERRKKIFEEIPGLKEMTEGCVVSSQK